MMLAWILTLPLNLFKGTWADYVERGNAKQGTGDYEGALADYSKAIELEPANVIPYQYRARARLDHKDWSGAGADYTKIIELQPYGAPNYFNRGCVKSAQGDFAAAIADYTKAVELEPTLVRAYYNRAYAQKNQGDPEGAIADYTEAIRLDPNYADAHFNRGLLRYDLQAFREALEDFRKSLALKLSGDYTDFVHFRIWLIRARMGEPEAATAELQAYLAKRQPEEPDAWLYKIGSFLVGQLSEPELFSGTKNPDKIIEAGRICEACFYAGSKWLMAGNKTIAGDYFRRSIASGITHFHEYCSAMAELELLK